MDIRQRFRQSLRCGKGEAYLIFRANTGIDFSRDIEKAALTNYAYDPQCEGDRAFYISQFIELSDKKELIVEAIIKALKKNKDDDNWALDHLFALSKIFAKQGNTKAKRAIYSKFDKLAVDNASLSGQEEILELDGIEGLKYIAEVIGKTLQKDSDEWEDSFTVDCFQEDNPKIKVYDELEKASKGNPYIRKYFEMIQENKWSGPKPRKKPKFDYKFVVDRIESDNRFPVPRAVARGLKKTDIKKLANDFLEEKDLLKKEKYLSVFSATKYPYGYNEILQIAKGKRRRSNRLVEFACESLAFFEGKDIRQFAIEKLSKTNIPSDYLPLLISNYKKGDHNLLAKIANRYKNDNVIHNFVYAYIDIYKANKTRQCKRPLEIIYSKLTCAIHRYDIVKILYDNGVLSKRIQKELEFDSSEEIRDFYKKISE